MGFIGQVYGIFFQVICPEIPNFKYMTSLQILNFEIHYDLSLIYILQGILK